MADFSLDCLPLPIVHSDFHFTEKVIEIVRTDIQVISVGVVVWEMIKRSVVYTNKEQLKSVAAQLVNGPKRKAKEPE